MAKKDFSTANTGRVYDAITEATGAPKTQEVQNPRRTYTPQEAAEMRAAGKTQGRKGCKAVRINMAFDPDVHEYLRVMAAMHGQSITSFANYVLKKSMVDNAELYMRAIQIQKDFK